MFTRYSVFKINGDLDKDKLELDLIDYGLEEIINDNENNELIIYGNFDAFGQVQGELENRNIEIISSDFERIPNNYKDLSQDEKNDLEKFLDMCENDDDVQKVYHNFKD